MTSRLLVFFVDDSTPRLGSLARRHERHDRSVTCFLRFGLDPCDLCDHPSHFLHTLVTLDKRFESHVEFALLRLHCNRCLRRGNCLAHLRCDDVALSHSFRLDICMRFGVQETGAFLGCSGVWELCELFAKSEFMVRFRFCVRILTLILSSQTCHVLLRQWRYLC